MDAKLPISGHIGHAISGIFVGLVWSVCVFIDIRVTSMRGTVGAVLLVLGLLQPALAKTQFELNFIKANCTSHVPAMVERIECTISKNAKRQSFSLEMQFKEDLWKFYGGARMSLPHPAGDRTLFNITGIDGCNLLSAKNQIFFLQVAMKQMEKYSNIPRKCPLRKDTLYYIRNYRLDLSQLAVLSFETEIDFWATVTYNNIEIIRGYVRMRTRRKQFSQKN